MTKRTPDRRTKSPRRPSTVGRVDSGVVRRVSTTVERTLDALKDLVRQSDPPRIEEQRATSGLVPAVTASVVFAETLPAPAHAPPTAEIRRASELSALVLDEIQSPLLVALAQLDSVAGDPSSSDEAKTAARQVQEIIEASRGLLMDFVDVTSSEAGGLTPRSERTDVGRLVAETCMGLGDVARRKPVTLDASVTPRGTAAWLDPRLVRRVLRNVLLHAVQNAAPSSVVTVRAQLAKGQLDVSVQHDGDAIPETVCRTAFRKFAKLDESHTAIRRSPGLSLHFCQVAVEAMHGQLTMEPLDPRGARVRFTIPDR
jgi:two-component system, OmpR family, heavy metal sensor histidine kinase CusS